MVFKLFEYKLADLVEIKYGKNQKKVEDENGAYPILGTGGVMGYANDYLYDKPSVLIGRKGSISKVKYIDEPFWTVDTLFYTKVNEEIVIPKYLYYILSMIDFNYYNEGTTIPSLRTETLNQITVKVPDLNTQLKQLVILENIERKIALNSAVNDNLERLIRLIFKRWFIEFEFPNEQGIPYRSSGGEMVGSELGEVPLGWNIVNLREITKLYKSTFNPKKSDEVEVKHFSLPAFDSKKYPTLDKVVDIKSNKWIVEDNCVLFSKMNPITPRIWIPKTHEQFLNVASSEFVVLKNDTFAESAFIYSLCTSYEFIEYLKANATGSTNSRQRITPDKALEYKFAMNPDILTNLSNILAPFVERLRDLREENNKLEELRELLLPKLLSGEIEIPDESVVEPS